ncbi:MAG: sporulation integral membrane protein YtvI [Lachnospiraceae bacterium]|nr:sporulation integral membrane protein YtvI [Lachnospiraceae bacterium]
MKNKNSVPKLMLNVILPIVFLVLLILIVPRVCSLFLPFVIGYIISLMANPLVKFLDKKIKIKRKMGSVVVIVIVLALVVLILYGIFLACGAFVNHIMGNLPSISASLKSEYDKIIASLTRIVYMMPKDLRTSFETFGDRAQDAVTTWISGLGTGTISTQVSKMASNIPGVLIGIIFGLLSAYFFIADKLKIEAWLKKNMSDNFNKTIKIIKVDCLDVIGGYFKAQFKIMAVVYVVLVIGLGIFKAPYYGVSAFGIAFVDMLPFFGTGTILGPWAVVKILTGEYAKAIYLIILYLVTQLVRQLIQPKLLGDSIGMNPFATLFFMYVGYLWGSVLGMIIAVPVAMLFINLCKSGAFDDMVYSAKTLYDMLRNYLKLEK